jgi:hypothetical protein
MDWGFVRRQNFLNAGKKKIDKKKSADRPSGTLQKKIV